MDDVVKNIVERAKQRREIIERARLRKSPIGAVHAFGLGAADAAAFGWQDEAAGLGGMAASYLRFLQSPLREEIRKAEEAGDYQRAQTLRRMAWEEMKRDYEIMRDEVREAQKAYQKAHPGAFTVGQIAGALPAAVSVGAATPSGAMLLRNRMALEAGLSALGGALYGAGSSEKNVLKDTLTGAAVGGAIGGSMPLVRAGLQKAIMAFRGAKPMPAPAFPEKGITKDVTRKVMKEIVRGDSLSDVMERAQLAGKELGTLMDASPSVARMAKGIYQTDIPARNRLAEFLKNRSAKSYERAVKVMDDLLGSPKSTKQLIDELSKHAYGQARPYYRLAEMQKVPVNLIGDLAERPAFRSALRKALRMAANEGVHLDDETAKVVNAILKGSKDVEIKGGLPVKVIDYVQRALNDAAMAAEKKAPNTARVMSNLRSELLKRIDDYVPPFKAARALAKNKFDLERAIKTGESVMNPNVMPEDVAAAVTRMTPEEQAAMRQGIRNVLRQRLENVINPAIAAERLSKRPLVAKKLRAALGKKADDLLTTVDREALFRETRDIVTAGSHTAQNVASEFHPIERGIRGYVRRALDKLIEYGRDMSRRELADAITTLVTDTGQMRDAVLRSLQEALKSEEMKRKLGKKTAEYLRKYIQGQLLTPVVVGKTKEVAP